MSLVIRMARAGTKKRPFYHIVVADLRSPRDGRFIERLGFFNPLLPKDKTERLKLDLDKVKDWMTKGAQPSDRVSRFLDAAGVLKREKRNNPEKAIPRKERKAKAEEAPRPRKRGDAAAKPRGSRQGRRGAEGRRRRAGERELGELTRAWAGAQSASPDRRRAWRARRGAAVAVHAGPDGGRALRPAGNRGRRAAFRDRERCAPAKDHLVARIDGRRRSRRRGSACAISSCSCRASGCRRSRRPTRSITPTWSGLRR